MLHQITGYQPKNDTTTYNTKTTLRASLLAIKHLNLLAKTEVEIGHRTCIYKSPEPTE